MVDCQQTRRLRRRHHRGQPDPTLPRTADRAGRLAAGPPAHLRIASFHLDYSVPVWSYEVGDQTIEARIWMEPGAHTTYAAWRLQPAPNSPDAELSLRITLLVN